jgi:aminoglycoside phosphotransferase (APT) family kinase protein
MDSSEFAGTMPVPERQRFDQQALSRYLQRHLPAYQAPFTVLQFRGGQSNPTFLVTAADGARFVLRKQPCGTLLPSAHALDREFRVLQALHGTAVPVAQPLLLCSDASVIGTMFYVMSHVTGRNFWDATLPGVTVAERAAMYDDMNRVLAALHTLDYAAAGLGDYGRPGGYVARQIARWSKQYLVSASQRCEAMDELIAWLPAHIPAGDETALVHGDYRCDNLIFGADSPRVLAVIDWELSTLGHPLADLAYHVMLWRTGAGEVSGLHGVGLAALGIPAESEYVALYCRRTGRASIDPRAWEYYIAYNLFRIASIRFGIARRVLSGTAASLHAREAGERAAATAALAWRHVRERLTG